MNMKEKLKKTIKKHPNLYSSIKNIDGYSRWYLNKLLRYLPEKHRFYRKTGYWPDLKEPRSFNEKVLWKKINDRNPLLPVTADKHRVRSYVKEVLGEEKAEEILIPQLFVTDDPEEIPFEDLPEDFVVKANHGSGTNRIIRNGDFDREKLIKECKRWLKTPYGLGKLEWAYQEIDRKIIVEKLIKNEEGKIPKDYKFYIFHRECELIHIDFGRYKNHKRTFFDANWNYLPISLGYPKESKVNEPENLEKIINIAEELGQKFDFVRVDLYSVDEKIYFGELTHYPGSGMKKFKPKSFDFKLGENWDIEKEYWKD